VIIDGQLAGAVDAVEQLPEALVWTLALPRFLSAGTVRAARIPRIAMTTSNSMSVNADGRRTSSQNLYCQLAIWFLLAASVAGLV